ncbi:MAG TPA: hypothetical protein VN456_07640 [Desulfosporosinus sp.]|nr:hypothetical protein [Desulfosporosinus sp.]
MIETIREYLVSLGFKVDNSSLNTTQNAMKTAEASVAHFANESVKDFAKATTGIATFVAAATVGLAKFMHSLAQSDLAIEMQARSLWMSKDAAKAYKASIDALGVSINDLYLSPELMNKYLELNRQAREMAVPTDEYTKQMQGVREITFQFQRLKLEGTYALQWIGYYLTKYLAGPMGNVKNWLTEINDKIQENMPQWTKRVAEVTSWVVRLAKAAWSIRDALGAAAGAFTAISLIKMASNPFGAFVLGLTALLLLVDDFNTYMSGGESAFPKLWEWIEKFKKSFVDKGYMKDFMGILKDIVQGVKDFGATLERIGNSETFQNFIKDIKAVVFKLGEILQSTGEWFADFFKTIKENGDLEKFGTDIGKLADSFVRLVTAIGDLMLKAGKGGLGDILKANLIDTLERIDGFVRSITGGLQIITGFLTGDKSKIYEGFDTATQGVDDTVLGKEQGKKAWEWQKGVDDYFNKNSQGDGFSNALKNSQNSPWSKFLAGLGFDMSTPLARTSQGAVSQTSFSSFKNSIPGASGASTVDWSALKKGFVAFMNSIPQEFGDISKGLFKQTSALAGVSGTNHMSYLYPQSNTSNMTQITNKLTTNVYGATQPVAVAQTVQRNNQAMLTRFHQGMIR